MANETAALVVALSAQLTKFQSDMDTASAIAGNAVKGIEDSFSKLNPDASKFMSNFADAAKGPAQDAGNTIGVALLAGFGVAIAAIVTKIGTLIDGLSKIGDRADELRLPVNLLQALSVAADEARVPQEKLNKALDKFTEVSKASKDTAEDFYKALSNVGKGFVDAFEKAPTQAARLDVIANALRSTTDEVKRAQLAQTAFKTDNEQFISILAGGEQGIAAAGQRMRELGLAIDEAAVKRAQEARTNLSLLARVIGDELSSSLGALVPTLASVVPLIIKMSAAVRDFFDALKPAEQQGPKALESNIKDLETQITNLEALQERIATGDGKGVGAEGSFQQAFNTKLGQLLNLTANDTTDRDKLIAIGEKIDEFRVQLDKLKQARAEFEASDVTVGGDPNKGAHAGGPGAFKPRPLLNPAAGSQADPFQTQVDSINRHIAALNADAAAVGKTAAEHQQLRTEVSLLQAIEREGGEVTQAQIDSYAVLRASMTQQEALTAAGIELNQRHADSFTSVSQRMLTAADAADKTKLAFQGIQNAVQFGGNQLIDIMDGLRNKTLSAADAMKNLTNNLIRALEQALLLGQGPLAGLLGTATSVPGGTGGLGAIFSSFFSGARASGGSVSAGGAYLVGENGPELFKPNASGNIIPNAMSAGRGGGQTVEINNYVSADTETRTQRRQDPAGGERMIVDIVRKAQARGDFDDVNRGRFGVRPTKVR